jgi:type II secretory pathway pseudopilin PulG
MVKKIIAVVLIVLAGGGWFYLDYRNKQEIREAEELRRSMEQARAQALAQAKAIAEAKAKFEAQILADLTTCKADAEKAKNDYVTRNQKPVRRKPGQFTIPQAVADEAARTLETANAACQATYDTRLQNGS